MTYQEVVSFGEINKFKDKFEDNEIISRQAQHVPFEKNKNECTKEKKE